MELKNVIDRISAVSISKNAVITQLQHEEDSELYHVWRIDTDNARYILKEAKENERRIYESILCVLNESTPKLFQVITLEDKTYLLIEYVEGENLCRCTRPMLVHALDALISLQQKTWEGRNYDHCNDLFDKSLLQRENRGMYLNDPLLEEAYEKFMTVYKTIPKALCHDDLLPFNVIVSDKKAWLIDWEIGGILPYPTSFARLVAHVEDDPDAFFYMTQLDKSFAIEYYYENLLKEKGITYSEWLDTLEYFLFYEYCDWVFVGNKYNATGGEYYKKYLPKALEQAAKLLKIDRG